MLFGEEWGGPLYGEELWGRGSLGSHRGVTPVREGMRGVWKAPLSTWLHLGRV